MIERVLVVDDDQSLREFLTITLGREGFEQLNAIEQKYAVTALEPRAADAMRLAAGEEPEHLRDLMQLVMPEPARRP